MVQIVQHHKKYKEIDGVDEITLMTRSEHTKLHIKLNKEGKWEVPENFKDITKRAYDRSPNGIKRNRFYHRLYMKEYMKNPINKEKARLSEKKYLNSGNNRKKAVDRAIRYNKQNVDKIDFFETIEPKIRLSERLVYNKPTGNVHYYSVFEGHGCDLYFINE